MRGDRLGEDPADDGVAPEGGIGHRMGVTAGQKPFPAAHDGDDPVNEEPIMAKKGDHVADLQRSGVTAESEALAGSNRRQHAHAAERHVHFSFLTAPEIGDRAEPHPVETFRGRSGEHGQMVIARTASISASLKPASRRTSSATG